MHKLFSTAVMLCLLGFRVLAQDKAKMPTFKFGEVAPAEVQMTAYPKDSSAEAVVLYDNGINYFEVLSNNIYITQVIHERIKILKKSALERGSIKIQLYKGSSVEQELLSDVKGFTYNYVNGAVVKDKLTKDMIFQEKNSDNYSATKISMPNVKEGSIIEYTYKVQTPLQVNTSPKTWYFQQDIPVEWSDYKITIPVYFYYRMLMNGYLGLHLNESKEVNVGEFNTFGTEYHFVLKDAPSFRDEAYITTDRDYLSKIDFELASVNWPNVMSKDFSLDYKSMNKNLLERDDFGEQIKKSVFLKDAATSIKKQSEDSTDRLQAAVNYIRTNVKWNEGESIYCKGLKKIFEKKTGDAGDINLMLIALLREIGFDANPVILSTRDHGRIHEQFALLKRFNYVVAHIEKGGKDYFLDATDEHLKVGMLPQNCLNHQGWLVHPTSPRLVSTEPTEKDVEFEKAMISINEEGEMKGNFTKSYAGYSAWGARKLIKKEGKEKFLEEVKKAKTNWTITKADYTNLEEVEKPIEAKYEVEMTDFVTTAGNMMYLKPMLSEGHTENPFKASERLFPVDLSMPIEETFMATYEIPKGYSILESPKNVSIALPENGGKFTYVVTKTENSVSVTSRLNFRKSIYSSEEYHYLKELYDQVVKKHSEQIVLKKM